MSTVEFEITIQPRRRRGARQGKREAQALPRIPRITRLMALAIKFQDMVARGEVSDYAELASLGHVTRARMTQITNLLLLAPAIQEDILFGSLPSAASAERHLRSVTTEVYWQEQRRLPQQPSRFESASQIAFLGRQSGHFRNFSRI